MGPAGSQASQRRGVWEPLPAILYGYAVHPLSTGQRRDSFRDSKVNSDSRRLSGVKDQEDTTANDMIVALDVGDDVYAFERYVPKAKEVDGIWYRGCVFAVDLTFFAPYESR